jgi:ketosteroid isomerase-like protein
MKVSGSVILLVLTLIVFTMHCGSQKDGAMANQEAELKEITRVIDSCIGWFKTKDFKLGFSTVAQDEDFLEVHPTDRVVKGFVQFKKNAEIFKKPGVKYVSHEIRDLTVKLSRTGQVAWFYCVLDDFGDWEGKIAGWKDTRWTGVLEKRNGRWVIVQQHFSFAKKN